MPQRLRHAAITVPRLKQEIARLGLQVPASACKSDLAQLLDNHDASGQGRALGSSPSQPALLQEARRSAAPAGTQPSARGEAARILAEAFAALFAEIRFDAI